MPCHIGVLFFHPIHFVGFPPIETTLIIALSIHYDEELNCWFFASSLTIIKFWQVESLKKLEYFWILIYTKFFIYLLFYYYYYYFFVEKQIDIQRKVKWTLIWMHAANSTHKLWYFLRECGTSYITHTTLS